MARYIFFNAGPSLFDFGDRNALVRPPFKGASLWLRRGWSIHVKSEWPHLAWVIFTRDSFECNTWLMKNLKDIQLTLRETKKKRLSSLKSVSFSVECRKWFFHIPHTKKKEKEEKEEKEKGNFNIPPVHFQGWDPLNLSGPGGKNELVGPVKKIAPGPTFDRARG